LERTYEERIEMSGWMFALPITGVVILLIVVAYVSWHVGYDDGWSAKEKNIENPVPELESLKLDEN